jgi:hypothetical protein
MSTPEGNQNLDPTKPIIAQLEDKYPGKALMFAAAWSLTDAPLQIRKTFLEEFAAVIAETHDVADPYKAAVDSVIYAGGYTGDGQKYIDAWREAAPEGEHPDFGTQMPDSIDDIL